MHFVIYLNIISKTPICIIVNCLFHILTKQKINICILAYLRIISRSLICIQIMKNVKMQIAANIIEMFCICESAFITKPALVQYIFMFSSEGHYQHALFLYYREVNMNVFTPHHLRKLSPSMPTFTSSKWHHLVVMSKLESYCPGILDQQSSEE